MEQLKVFFIHFKCIAYVLIYMLDLFILSLQIYKQYTIDTFLL